MGLDKLSLSNECVDLGDEGLKAFFQLKRSPKHFFPRPRFRNKALFRHLSFLQGGDKNLSSFIGQASLERRRTCSFTLESLNQLSHYCAAPQTIRWVVH